MKELFFLQKISYFLKKAGQLMNESHQSLRDDFEMFPFQKPMYFGCLISECARESPGCYGARMTTGGYCQQDVFPMGMAAMWVDGLEHCQC